ncbi:MAG: DEAD/DEAH box helicase, partial [Methanobacteriota archaeon]
MAAPAEAPARAGAGGGAASSARAGIGKSSPLLLRHGARAGVRCVYARSAAGVHALCMSCLPHGACECARVWGGADYDDNSKMVFESTEDVAVVPSFESMGLKPDLLRGIFAYGFEKPSAIQQRAIIPIVKGRDLIAQSQSGTGKTAVFCIGILQSIDVTSSDTQALVLSPTRELAEQSEKVLRSIGDFMSVKCHACIGGKHLGEDLRRLEAGVQVISGTPGRVFDLIRRG